MRVTIDATALLVRSAGVKSYVWHWLRALQQSGSEHEFRGFPLIDTFPLLRHDRSIYSDLKTYPRIAALHAANHVPGVLDALIHGSGIFHASNQVRRTPKHGRLTSTIHDVTAFNLGSLHTAGNRRADEEWADRVLKRADKLIAVSEHTKRDAVERLGIPPDKITRIYSGVGSEYFTADDASINAVRATFKLHRPYVLCVGSIEPRKNIARLLDAWSNLSQEIRKENDLIVAGPYGWGAEETLRKLQAGENGARYLGYVDEQLLPALTAGATVMAYPSLYEGFGFPVAQAMAAGVAVLTSNTSCLPEVAGDGAAYVDPLSVTDLADTLARLLVSPEERKRLGAAGRLRAKQYTWANCARESIQFFEAVCGL